LIVKALAMPACTEFLLGVSPRVIGGFTVNTREFEAVKLSAFETDVIVTFCSGDVSPAGGLYTPFEIVPVDAFPLGTEFTDQLTVVSVAPHTVEESGSWAGS
jgi:hypothetical protein